MFSSKSLNKFKLNLLTESYLFKQETKSDSVFFILAGYVVLTHGEGSRETVVNYVGPGEVLGEHLFFNERIVSGFDAMFYTKAQAKRHCAAMRERYPKIKVDCRFAGEVLQPSEPKASP